jgi:hypothetical protein
MARRKIPKSIKAAVLDEYDHLCAICGGVRPQIHHIDENPDNDDPMNLIPLCPNQHLNDQHNPTRKIPIPILKLFREYKDPAILKPQFKPIHDRMFYLCSFSTLSCFEIEEAQRELTDFIASLEMGTCYEGKIWSVNPVDVHFTIVNPEGNEYERTVSEQDAKCHQTIAVNAKKVESLVIELLRYQEWGRAVQADT